MWFHEHLTATLLVSFGALLLATKTTSCKQGVDVSHYQGTVDWAKVKAAGKTFGVAKASQGSTYEDTTYKGNCEGMRRNGFRVGAYHYLMGAVPASDQVAKFRSVLAKCTPDIVVIDVEESYNEDVSPNQMADTLHGVLEGLRGHYRNLYIYTSPYYWEDKVAWRKYDFSKFKLWIAHYTSKSSPIIPKTWENTGYTWWQYTNQGKVDGIEGNVDLDRSKA